MKGYVVHLLKALNYHEFNKRALPVGLQLIKNRLEFKIKKGFWNDLPFEGMKLASKLPIVGTKSLKKNVKLFEGVIEKSADLEGVMNFFINGDWHYENKKIFDSLDKLSAEERRIFNCDVRTIHWPDYIVDYIKGLSIWALSEDQIEPVHNLKQIIHKNKRRFSDITFAMKPRNNFKEKNTEMYEKSILD